MSDSRLVPERHYGGFAIDAAILIAGPFPFVIPGEPRLRGEGREPIW
jgi:hypothetical protein